MWYKVKRIMVWDKQVRPETIPTSWLLWYRPLQTNLNDVSWNGKNASWYSWTGSFETSQWYTWARCNVSSTSWNQNYSSQHVITPINYVWVNLSYLWWINFFAKNWWQRPWFMNISWSWDTKYIYSWLRVSTNYRFTVSNNIANGWWLDYSTLNINTWYFIAVVYNNTEGKTKLYINWSKVAEATDYVWVQSTSNYVWRIGCWQYDAQYGGTNWLVRHCAIYNRSLTDAEVLQFYNQTN